MSNIDPHNSGDWLQPLLLAFVVFVIILACFPVPMP